MLLPYGQRAKVGGICVLWTHVKFNYDILFQTSWLMVDTEIVLVMIRIAQSK